MIKLNKFVTNNLNFSHNLNYNNNELSLDTIIINIFNESRFNFDNLNHNYDLNYYTNLDNNYNLNNKDLNNKDLNNKDLDNKDLDNKDLDNNNFNFNDLYYSNLENKNLYNIDLDDKDLENKDLDNIDLENKDLYNIDLDNIDLDDNNLEENDLDDIIMLPFNDSLYSESDYEKYNYQYNIESFTSIEFLSFLYKQFCYIGKLGRYFINKQLNRLYNEKSEFITFLDLFYSFHSLIDNIFNNTTSDIAYKRIISFIDFIEKYISSFFNTIYKIQTINYKKIVGFDQKNIELFFFIKNSIKININCTYKDPILFFFRPYIFALYLINIFSISPLGQNIEQQNCLAEICQKRKIFITSFKDQTKMMSSTKNEFTLNSLGRFCPLDCPEGSKAGGIITFSMDHRINIYQSIETQHILFKKNITYIQKQNLFFDIFQESSILNSLSISKKTISNKLKSSYMLLSKKNDIYYNILYDLSFTKLISSRNIFSINTNLLPFIENNDGNRILMSLNMQKQAIPLFHAYIPIISTNINTHIVGSVGTNIKSYCEGEIIYVSATQIQIKDLANQIITYKLPKYFKIHYNLLLTNTALIWPGEYVFSGQIISENSNTINSELCLGTNLLLAYTTWFSSTFEDAITINERLLKTNRLASLHILEYEVSFNIKKDYFITNFTNINKQESKYLDTLGIILPGTLVKTNSCLFTKFTSRKKEKSNFIHLLTNLIIEYLKEIRNYSLFKYKCNTLYQNKINEINNLKKYSLYILKRNFIGRILRIYCYKTIYSKRLKYKKEFLNTIN